MPIPANPRLGATGAQWDHRQLKDGGSHKRSSCEYQSFRIGPASNLPVVSVTGCAAKKSLLSISEFRSTTHLGSHLRHRINASPPTNRAVRRRSLANGPAPVVAPPFAHRNGHIFCERHEKAGGVIGPLPPPSPTRRHRPKISHAHHSRKPIGSTNGHHARSKSALAANARQSQGSTRSSPTSRSVLPDTGRGTGLSNTLLQLKFKSVFLPCFEKCANFAHFSRARARFSFLYALSLRHRQRHQRAPLGPLCNLCYSAN